MNEIKKVGLVSVTNNNYGSQLQTYAMQHVLLSLGVDNEIIRFKQKGIEQVKRLTNLKFITLKGRGIFRDIICKLVYPKISNGLKKRTLEFEKFKKNNCKYSVYITNRKQLKKYVKKYSAVVLGSDQVWHPANLEMDYFTLSFVPEQIPKLAYAPSFGVSCIPNSQLSKTKDYLSKINSISVRERAGAAIVKELIGRDVPIVCDPTALLTKEQWDLMKGNNCYCKEKYIFCYFIGKAKEHRNYANKVKGATGFKIVVLQHIDEFIKNDIGFGDIQPYDVGPENFISLIANAEIVLTDSFHVTMFSIYYHKNFCVFSRFAEKAKISTNSRIESILQMLNLEKRYLTNICEVDSCLKDRIQWEDVDKRLEQLRKKSLFYLKENLKKFGLINDGESNTSISNKSKEKCTGCTACVYSCPQHCIQMKEDDEGFLYPQVKSENCIQCGLCSKVCPTQNKGNCLEGKSYAARNTDKSVRLASSSGGMFNALATWVLDRKGIVVGAAFDEHIKLRHITVASKKNLDNLQASKYVQSDLGNIFSIIRDEVIKGRYVLFCGTPCQATGLKRFMKKDYTNLIIIDVLCYGVPSPMVFRKFIKFLENKHNSKVVNFYFRDKTFGYSSPNVKAVFQNNEIEEMTSDVKSFTKAFFSGITTRPSCFECKFKGGSRETDITLGDFWNVGDVNGYMDDDTGATLVFAHTKKGIKLLTELNNIEVTEIPYYAAVKYAGPMLNNSAKSNVLREDFFNDLKDKDYIYCVNKYAPESIKNKVANVIKPIMLHIGIVDIGILKLIKKSKIRSETAKYK